MTVLTKTDIMVALEDGRVDIGYPDETKPEGWDWWRKPEDLHIGPNSIDLHLHQDMKVYEVGRQCHQRGQHEPGKLYMEHDVYVIPPPHLDARKGGETFGVTIGDKGVVLTPGVLYLARTVERTNTPHHVPKIGGRSSTGRLGINIHQTAGFGDVGFNGTWTLELSVIHPVRIYAGMRIAQLWLFEISSELEVDDRYQGRYQGQVDPTSYRGHEED